MGEAGQCAKCKGRFLDSLGFGMAQGGPGRGGVVCKWGRWGAGWGWDGGCVWGSRGTVRVQAEVVVLLGQG